MKIHPSEINDGLQDIILDNTSLGFVSAVTCTPDEDIIPAATVAQSVSLDSSFATNEGQFDLHYVNTILVSTGWNKNDDVFDQKETWKARSTPEDKPFNYEHDPSKIIGHITGNKMIDINGNTVSGVSEDNLPNKFHILTSGVLYKHVNSRDEELEQRTAEIIEGIARGEWFVSMEALFTNFDYAVVTPSGDHKTIARNDESAFLTKHLRVYGGSGQYEQYRVGRLLKNITFSGKGLVRQPANPESVFIFEGVNTFASQETLNSFENSYSAHNIKKEKNSMSDNNNAELKQEIAELQQRLKEMDEAAVKAKFQGLEAQVNEKSETIDELTQTLEDAKASNEELAKANEELEKKIAESKENSDTVAAELADIKSEILKTSRVSSLVDAGVDKEEAEAIVENFANLSDE